METPLNTTAETPDPLLPFRIDLNTADATTLTAIPGIGPALAERILTYRTEHGPFLAIEELMAVSGIGEKVFAGAANHLTLSLPPMALPADAETVSSDEQPLPVEEVTVPPLMEVDADKLEGRPPPEETPPPAKMPTLDEPVAVEPLPRAADTPPPPPITPAPPSPHLTAPSAAPAAPATPAPRPVKRSAWSWWGWLSAVFMGSILGVIFSLLVLNGINGALNMAHHPAVIDLRNQTADLAARQETLRDEVNGLRQRLDRLEGLAARMERAEAAVVSLRDDMATLEEETAALQATAEALSGQITVLETRTARAETFFQRLQALLAELFDGAEPPTPVEPEVEP